MCVESWLAGCHGEWTHPKLQVIIVESLRLRWPPPPPTLPQPSPQPATTPCISPLVPSAALHSELHFKHPAVLMLHTDSCSRTVTGSARLLITELTHRAAMYFGPRSQNTPPTQQHPPSYITHAPGNSVAMCIRGLTSLFTSGKLSTTNFTKRQQTLEVFLRLTFQTELFVSPLE